MVKIKVILFKIYLKEAFILKNRNYNKHPTKNDTTIKNNIK